MKLQVLEMKKEELCELLGSEISRTFTEYITIIKGKSLEEIVNTNNLISITEEQTLQNRIYIGLLNAIYSEEFDLKTIKALVEIQRTNKNLIKAVMSEFNANFKNDVNIFNEKEMNNLIIKSVYKLVH